MDNDNSQEGNPFPFSRRLQASAVPVEGLEVVVRPNAEECAALAQQNDLRALTGLEARLHVARSGAEGLEVSGRLRAKVRQTCVVTLEDFDAEVDEAVRLRFAPPPRPVKAASAAPPGKSTAGKNKRRSPRRRRSSISKKTRRTR